MQQNQFCIDFILYYYCTYTLKKIYTWNSQLWNRGSAIRAHSSGSTLSWGHGGQGCTCLAVAGEALVAIGVDDHGGQGQGGAGGLVADDAGHIRWQARTGDPCCPAN